ncbi:MAG TPA: hypothetical protein GX497_03090 [Bacillus bacterium]|nr:hypothetical protein [Bacillus sp. (in: firmicutes)]
MAFANELMTKEETAEFKAKAIPNPGYRREILEPRRWTIDREKNVILIWCRRERFEPYDQYFLLLWKDIPIPMKLRDSWVSAPTREWELIYIEIPNELREKQDEIIQSLKDALVVYAYDGYPDEPFNKDTKVQFKF